MIGLSSRGLASGVDVSLVGIVRWHARSGFLGVFCSRSDFSDSSAAPVAVIRTADEPPPTEWARAGVPDVLVRSDLQPLSSGDIVALHPSGRIDTLFRVGSIHNSLFVTEQCNSYCLMCSQPPRNVDDIDYRLTLNARAVRLMPEDVELLGITGGEPTLLGHRLGELLHLCRSVLPTAQLDVLSNGRLLSDETLAARVSEACDRRVLFTIPLYADTGIRHDYIVQSSGSFDETIRGFYNLATYGVRTEVRVVLHRETVPRLEQLARFVQKNLPFVEQIAFMGLEMTGLARAHEELLWIEPTEYMAPLGRAVEYLKDLGLDASIYNMPRCVAPESLWPHLRLSISDWKREFLPTCETCREREACAGLFGTSSRLASSIHPLT